MRPASFFGHEDRLMQSNAKWTRFVRCPPPPRARAPTNGDVQWWGYGLVADGGKAVFSPTDVGDVANAVAKCAVNFSTANKTYELCGPQQFTRKQFMQFCMAKAHKDPLVFSLPPRLMELASYWWGVRPNPFLNRDMVRLYQEDETLSGENLPGYKELEIEPLSPQRKAVTYLHKWRPYASTEPEIPFELPADVPPPKMRDRWAPHATATL